MSRGIASKIFCSNNDFTGPLPKSLRNCSSLFRVRLEGNRLTGNLTEEFGIYPHLCYNLFGELSWKWGECYSLTSLKLSNNNISGQIPQDLRKAARLHVLDLSLNNLAGKIPKELGKLTELFQFTLNDNKLSGDIPLEIGMLADLEHLNLAANNLSGSIPSEIGNAYTLESLDLSWNLLGGEIPQQLKCLPQYVVWFSSGHFIHTRSLAAVDVCNNELEGPIPNSKAFYEASVEAFKNNKGLCGNISGLKTCPSSLSYNLRPKGHSKTIIVIVVPSSCTPFLLLGIVGIFYSLCRSVQKQKDEAKQAENQNIFAIWSYDEKMV